MATDIVLPKIVKGKIKVFTTEQQKVFIEKAKETYLGELFIFDLGTGLRLGELLALKWEDANYTEEIIRVTRNLTVIRDYDEEDSQWYKEFGTPKTESSIRSIPLLPDLIVLLKKVHKEQLENRLKSGNAWEDNDLVFSTKVYINFDYLFKSSYMPI